LYTKEETVTAMADTQSAAFHILKRHFDPSFEMLERLIDACPDGVWLQIWQQVYHTLECVDFWLRTESGDYHLRDFKKDVTPYLDQRCSDYLTQGETRGYLETMKEKAQVFFQTNRGRLFEPSAVNDAMTNADVILGQIRHIQYHVGDCNSILGGQGAQAVEWLGYGE
jgi:hypothetical protein